MMGGVGAVGEKHTATRLARLLTAHYYLIPIYWNGLIIVNF